MKMEKNILVPMKDGTRLALDLFKPDDDGPWPVVLVAYPYQKDGHVGFGCGLEMLTFLNSGYAYVLADLRGTGSSEGSTQDPFDPLRGDDLYTLVEWCGSQEWSTGKVGMTGESYGGMTSLTAAAESPPSLKAIVPVMSPVFFYRNLIFPGGSLNMLGMCGAWLNYMNVMNLLPPLYTQDREDWRGLWGKRLEAYTPYIFAAIEHTTYDEYWRKADIPVEKISVPTYIIEAWRGFSHRDGFQAFHALKGPKKILVGPWVHGSPLLAQVNPVAHLNEAIRWFDYWLKGEENGIAEEPPVTVHVLGKGTWKFEKAWPPDDSRERVLHLHSSGQLEASPDISKNTVEYKHDPVVGLSAGLMTVYPLGIDYPKEQTEDNARSLVFDTAPLPEALEIAGESTLTLTLSTDMPDAAITAKLCDVSPGGPSTFITSGWLRLSHREGHDTPSPPKSGQTYQIKIELWPVDYLIQEGHRLRLAISLSDFPRIFPLSHQGSIQLHLSPEGIQQLALRVLPAGRVLGTTPELATADLSILEGIEFEYEPSWKVVRDQVSDQVSVQSGMSMGFTPMHMASPIRASNHYSANVTQGRPETANIVADSRVEFALEGKRYVATAHQRVTQDQIEVSTRIDEEGKTVHEKTFEKGYSI